MKTNADRAISELEKLAEFSINFSLTDVIDRLDIIEATSEFKSRSNYIWEYLQIIRKFAPVFLKTGNPKNALRLYRRAEIQLAQAWETGLITYDDKNSFDSSLVRSLVESGDNLGAVQKGKSMIQEFYSIRQRIHSECIDIDEKNPSNPGTLPFIQLSFQDLCRYLKKISRAHTLNTDVSYFAYQERLFQLSHLRQFVLDYPSSWILRNEHKVGLESDRHWAVTNVTIKSRSGFKKVSMFINIIGKIIWIYFQKWFWGFGEKPTRLIVSMLITMSLYSLIFHTNEWIKGQDDIFTSLYFSLITFTGMGDSAIILIPEPVPRFIASSEAFIGVILIALFIFVIGRKSSY